MRFVSGLLFVNEISVDSVVAYDRKIFSWSQLIGFALRGTAGVPTDARGEGVGDPE